MSVNFYAHRDDIVTAWKEVLDDKSSIDWALFGYVKQSNDLEVVSKGTGLEDLAEEFNSSKILYAFTKVIDPNSEMPKFVLINWQGEGAPIARKGVCANHQSDVKSFLKGVHMTINARTEEEVEPSAVLEKVSKSTTTKLSLKERSDPNENPLPVGSNYKRIQASSEINSSARESFWNQQQEEEKKRKIEEKKRQEEERMKLVEQASAREAKEAQEREAHVLKRDHEINKRREEEKNAENRARNIERENLEKQKAERVEAERACAEKPKLEAKPVSPKPISASSHDDEDPEEEISKRSEVARRARAEEARKLISGSSIKNARALFESNSSAGQLSQPTKQSINVAPRRKLTPMVVTNGASSLASPKEASPKDASPKSSDSNNQDSNLVDSQSPLSTGKATALESSQPSVQVSEKVLPPDGRQRHDSIAEETVPEEDEEDEEEVDDEEGEYSIENERVVYHPEHRDSIEQHALEDIQEEAEEEEAVYDKNQPIGDQGLRARALYDYQAADETEISFDPDDILTHVDKIDPGWFQGFAPDGSYGLFPANYVELLDD